jgi:hypothetical protein
MIDKCNICATELRVQSDVSSLTSEILAELMYVKNKLQKNKNTIKVMTTQLDLIGMDSNSYFEKSPFIKINNSIDEIAGLDISLLFCDKHMSAFVEQIFSIKMDVTVLSTAINNLNNELSNLYLLKGESINQLVIKKKEILFYMIKLGTHYFHKLNLLLEKIDKLTLKVTLKKLDLFLDDDQLQCLFAQYKKLENEPASPELYIKGVFEQEYDLENFSKFYKGVDQIDGNTVTLKNKKILSSCIIIYECSYGYFGIIDFFYLKDMIGSELENLQSNICSDTFFKNRDECLNNMIEIRKTSLLKLLTV